MSVKALSQNAFTRGLVIDSQMEPAIGAAVILLKTDSTIIKGVTTNTDGRFILTEISPGTYILKVTYLGSANYFRNINIVDSLNLGKIRLKNAVTNLREVEVLGKAVMATQSGDTSSFNSAAFKVNKDANAEDLVTKMPGVVLQDGKVQAQGEEVKQVLVDGQVFFGEDASSVLKNLPAEIVDKVQVFDRRSDQSQFTGFDDGNTSKVINIVTKSQFRNGLFGRAYAGYGNDDRYRAGGVINRFKDKQRFTFILMGNNINEQNFASEDLLGVAAGNTSSQRGGGGPGRTRGGGGGGRGSNETDNFLVGSRNGINTTHAAGLNYSDKWGVKTTISASYFFNATANNSETSLLRQYVIGSNSGLNYSELNLSQSDNYNHRFNSRIEIKIDSSNSLIIQPKISLQQNSGKSSFTGTNANSEILISSITNSFKSKLEGYDLSTPLQYRHSLKKRGRTISLDLTPSYIKNSGNNNLQTYNTFYLSGLTDTIDQRSEINKESFSARGNLVYTEPLSQTSFLSINYTANYVASASEKNTMRLDPQSEIYSIRDSLLSNVFDNQYVSNAAGASYRYNREKINFSFGAAVQQAVLSKNQMFPASYSESRIFNSFVPNGSFQYKFTPKKNIRFFYRSFNNAPSIDQLQNVVNNNNTLQLSTGNPTLRQTFQNNFNLRYSGVNTEKSTSFFALLGGTYTDDYIGNSTTIASSDTTVFDNIFLSRGSQLTRPVNLSNHYTLRTFINYSFPIKFFKSTFNINASASYNNVPALINDELNYSNTTNSSIGLVLSSNVSEKVDFMISTTPSYNYVSNTLQQNLNSVFYNQISRAKLTVTPVKWLQFQADYSNQFFSGLTGGFNQNISIFNASAAYKFLKNQQAELRLSAYDILNQNNSIQRTTTDTYIEDAQTNILRRYFLLTFTYNIRKYFENKTSENTQK